MKITNWQQETQKMSTKKQNIKINHKEVKKEATIAFVNPPNA
jgi:hypothetical protein